MDNLFDSHCHIYSDEFEGMQSEIIARAKENNVTQMLVIGCDRITTEMALELQDKHVGVYAAAAWHPVDVIGCTEDDMEYLINLWETKKVVAIGETGLDYHWDTSPKELQKKFFRWHLDQAIKYQLPFIIHNREATEDVLIILKEYYAKYGPLRGVMHSFSGSLEMAKEFLKLGLHLSVSGVVTFKNAKHIKEVVPMIPNDKILIETDAPYLTPTPYRGKRNEPAFIRFTAEEVAKLRGITVEEIAELTTKNTCLLFGVCR